MIKIEIHSGTSQEKNPLQSSHCLKQSIERMFMKEPEGENSREVCLIYQCEGQPFLRIVSDSWEEIGAALSMLEREINIDIQVLLLDKFIKRSLSASSPFLKIQYKR